MQFSTKEQYELFLGHDTDDKIRKMAIILAIVGFFGHLLLWVLIQNNSLKLSEENMRLFYKERNSMLKAKSKIFKDC